MTKEKLKTITPALIECHAEVFFWATSKKAAVRVLKELEEDRRIFFVRPSVNTKKV